MSSSEHYRRPELFLGDLLRREARGEKPDTRLFYRAVVLAIDFDGGRLENPNGTGTIDGVASDGRPRKFTANVGPSNPRGSIKARLLTDGFDRLDGDDAVRVFWPLLPFEQISIPIAPGEHVYVAFEGRDDMEHGLWFARVSSDASAGVSPGRDSYRFGQVEKSAADAFVENDAPDVDDAYASEAPPESAMRFFTDVT